MTDARASLPVGTTIEFDNGDVYRIMGSPIGSGGGSILYPAQRQFLQNGILQTDGLLHALKECYPASVNHAYIRAENGEIIPASNQTEEVLYLHRAQLLQLEEETVTKHIYRTASRMLPIRRSSQSVFLTLPGQRPAAVANTVTVMDSLAEKGQSVTAWMKKQRRFAPAEAFRVIQQVLFALQEVHQAGYLHLDIQDGNVFLRGTLEQKNELATLIDFGCARELIDGKTAPIRDKVIFTTQGFSAPEILLHNDGSLQLGPEADIYSVGCLALYLLTGQRANVRELMANRTGIYLRSNQLRRIRCPKHLVDPMQRILAKALAKEPENRYPSAEEMLKDVTALAEALQPRHTDLNTVNYDAFVCYRHGPVDSAAALTLQRALENYCAPKGVSEKKRPFGRVFVDEGELSSCADFGQQIREALKNSRWLIVICSPDTPLSPWVQLEIDTFLEYHDRSRILAVLTGGSPECSFPPQLKADAGGEVFAAHAMSSTPQEAQKQLKGDALLKIAAPILGTTYDTLKQRHKIYRLQRLAVVTAGFLLAAVGFAAYAVNRAKVISAQALRIEEEYQRSLINESLFLAEQAEKKLADKDPLGAMELALQALPSETQNRPVLTEAEYALGKALGIYTTPSVAEDTAAPVGKIDTACPYFFLNADGTNLFAWDDSVGSFGSRIQCWNTDNLSLDWEVSFDHGIFTQPFVSSGGKLYVMGYHNLHCLDAATGSEHWSLDIANTTAMALSQEESRLLVLSEEDASGAEELSLTGTVFDSETGEILHQTHFRIDGNLRIEGPVCISPDLRFAAIPTVDKSSQDFTWHSYNSLYLADLEGETCHKLLDSQTAVCAMRFVGDTLAVLRGNGYTLTTQHNVLYEYNTQYTYWLETYRISDRSLIWQQQITDYFETGGISEILQTGYDDGSAAGTGLLFLFDDHCVLVDQPSGTILRQYTLPAAAVTLSLTEAGFETVNTDGSYTATGFSIDTVMHIQYFSPTVSEVCQKNGMYFIQNETLLDRDHTICKYQLNWSDDAYAALFTADSNAWRVSPGPEGMVLLTDRNRICLVNTHTAEAWQHTIPEEYAFSEYNIVGLSADPMRVYWKESGHWEDPECWINDSKYYALDFATGEIARLPQPPEPHSYTTVYDMVFDGDEFVLVSVGYEDSQDLLCIFLWDPVSGTLEERFRYPLPAVPLEPDLYWRESYLYGSFDYQPERGQLCFALCDNTERLTKLVSVDMHSGEATEIPLQLLPETETYASRAWKKGCFQWNPSGTQAVFVFDGAIRVADLTGRLVCEIPVSEELVSLQFSPEEQDILAVFQSGVLSRYRIEDASLCASLNLAEHCSSLYGVYADGWSWEFPDDHTLLAISNFGGFLMDLSGEDIKMKAIISQCIGYDPVHDNFIVAETDSYSGKPTTIGSFRRYTTEALIQKANHILSK